MSHPAELDDEALLTDVTVSRGRAGGPGGQHRNKVETHISMTHRPSGIVAQAGERRSQDENKRVALFRLRLALAMGIRTERESPSALWQRRAKGGRLKCNPSHRDFPSLVAEALDWLATSDWDGRAAATALSTSTSQLVKFLKLHPPAVTRWNDERAARGLRALK